LDRAVQLRGPTSTASQDDIARNARHEAAAIPSDFDFSSVSLACRPEVRQEARDGAFSSRPTLGQAARIAGVTPAAISPSEYSSRRA
jgi:tRNA U34 5-carboxymethylaminomethyl modifying enzyme MnmG/GidA